MKKLSKKIKLVAIAASVGMAFATPVYSGAIATAILDISNLKFIDSAGNNLNNIDDIQILSGNNFGNLSADLNSIPGSTSSSQNANIFDPFPILSPSAGAFNGTQISEGPATRLEDDYGFRVVPPAAGSSYTYADNILNGASIDLDINGNGVIDAGDILAGVNASTIADVELNSTDFGNATATTGTNFAFEFIALQDQVVSLDFDFAIQTLAHVDPGSASPSSATSTVSWNLDLTDGVTTQTFNPTDLNITSARSDIFTGLDDKNNNAGHATLNFNLVAGTRYQVGIGHQVQANASSTVVSIPEPGILALLGLGLAAFGVQRRKV